MYDRCTTLTSDAHSQYRERLAELRNSLLRDALRCSTRSVQLAVFNSLSPLGNDCDLATDNSAVGVRFIEPGRVLSDVVGPARITGSGLWIRLRNIIEFHVSLTLQALALRIHVVPSATLILQYTTLHGESCPGVLIEAGPVANSCLLIREHGRGLLIGNIQ